MQTIHGLRLNVTGEDAVGILRGNHTVKRAREIFGKPLHSAALVYLPFHLFRIEICNGHKRELQWLAQDAVTGDFDPYSFEREVGSEHLEQVLTRNFAAEVVCSEQAQDLIKAKVRRLAFVAGFFRIRDFEVDAQFVGPTFYVPYWIGFYRARHGARLRVLDAIRGRIEGAKVRNFFYEWLQN